MAQRQVLSEDKPKKPYVQLSFFGKVIRDITKRPTLYIIMLPVILYYILFCYKPMYGALIAFTDYIPESHC